MKKLLRIAAYAVVSGALATSCIPASPQTYTNPKDCVAAGYEWEIDQEAPNGICETD